MCVSVCLTVLEGRRKRFDLKTYDMPHFWLLSLKGGSVDASRATSDWREHRPTGLTVLKSRDQVYYMDLKPVFVCSQFHVLM